MKVIADILGGWRLVRAARQAMPTPCRQEYLVSVAQTRRRSADFSPQRSAHRKDAAECSGGGGTFERCCGLKSALRRLACGTLNRYQYLVSVSDSAPASWSAAV